jgi:hypothetical protein
MTLSCPPQAGKRIRRLQRGTLPLQQQNSVHLTNLQRLPCVPGSSHFPGHPPGWQPVVLLVHLRTTVLQSSRPERTAANTNRAHFRKPHHPIVYKHHKVITVRMTEKKIIKCILFTIYLILSIRHHIHI